MMHRRDFTGLGLAAMAVALSGCRVDTVAVNSPPPPGYPPPPRQGAPYRIAGVWGWIDGRGRERIIEIDRTRGGLLARGRRSGESVFYERIGPGIFEDERGRRYEFVSDNEAYFRRPNGRSFAVRRL